MSIAACRQRWAIAICLFGPLRSLMAIGINSYLSHIIDDAAVNKALHIRSSRFLTTSIFSTYIFIPFLSCTLNHKHLPHLFHFFYFLFLQPL